MSDRTEEDDVDWAPVDDEECEQLFAESDDEKEDATMMSEDEADEATHPSTQFTAGPSSDEDTSSVEETKEENETKDDGFADDNWEDQSRPSWVTNDSTVGNSTMGDAAPLPTDSMSAQKPPPYTPSPSKIANSEVERLNPGTSRLASFSTGLQKRFSASDNGSTSMSDASGTHEGNGVMKPMLFPKDPSENKEDDFPESEPWPGDDAEASREAEGGDTFAANSEAKAVGSDQPNTPIDRELSNNSNWMKFDDDKWDSSKHTQGTQGTDEDNVEQKKKKTKSASFSADTPMTSSTKKKKKKGFSLEDGLAKVSEQNADPDIAPAEERQGGALANELVSFWGEGEEEDESANDPLAMALKKMPADEQRPDRSDERQLYDSSTFGGPKSNYSQLSSPHSKKEPEPGPGWIQKGIGSAVNLVTTNLTNLPFTKPKDTDEPIKDDNVEEVEDLPVEEVEDLPFPNATNRGDFLSTAAQRPIEHRTSMADVSAISEDSAFARRRSQMSASMPLDIRADTAITTLGREDLGYDPAEAVLEKMIDNSESNENEIELAISKGIKFSKETKMEKKSLDIFPIFDLFIDLPHPSCDEDLPEGKTTVIGCQTDADGDLAIQNDIQDNMEDISCLTFPEHDSSIVQEEQDEGAPPVHGKTPMEVAGFQHYTFTLKLDSGVVYAHVRRYLPTHRGAVFRYDVGRRLGRALVMFTRFPGGDDFFAMVLKTLDAVSSQHISMYSMHISRPQKWFLQSLQQKHYRLCEHYSTNLEDRRGGPHILTLQGLEYADCMEHYAVVDATHFFLPNHILHKPVIPGMKSSHTCSVLPVIRCLGVVNTLRLLSALLSERRIIFVSISPTRLDRSVRSASAILAQGMLNWGHMCMPVLPADLWSILKSPEPYLVGVMAPLAYRLELTDGLGDVVVFDLDENSITALGDQKLAKLVPDLCRSLSEAMIHKRRIALPENVATEKDMTALAILNSTSDFLAQDLSEIVKADKQTMNGTSVTAKHVAKKAKKVVTSTLNFIWGGGGKEKDEEGEQEVEVKKSKKEKRMEADAIYIEGCRNEAGEEATRLAFVSFFLRILGNHEGYVYETENSDYNFDKEKFLRERKARGDGGNSPVAAMLNNFCEGQMVLEFVRMREQHIRARHPTPIDAPLFWQCIDFLELKDIDFGILNIRSVSRMMLQKTSVQQMLPSNVRRLAMAITSKRKFEGHFDHALADLAELSRESGAALYDVMSVIWLRTRDCKGLQWVHGYQAMKVLKEVLLHGPLAAVADATDGFQRIRMLAFRKSQGCDQIQEIALEILNLLSDRSRLFLRRRVAAEKRRMQRDPDDSPLTRDTRLNLAASFRDIHASMNPALRPPEPRQRRSSLASRRASLSSRLPHRLSITKHIMALEPLGDEDSITSFPNMLPIHKRASAHNEFLHDTIHRPAGESVSSFNGDFATARRYVREISRKTQESEKERNREMVRRRDSNAMGVELIKKQFMLLKVAIYMCPIFYIFGNHEHFLTIVMFLWLSQQLQVFQAPIDSGTY